MRGGIFDELQERYWTLEEAMHGHERMVARCKLRPNVVVALRAQPALPIGVLRDISNGRATVISTGLGPQPQPDAEIKGVWDVEEIMAWEGE